MRSLLVDQLVLLFFVTCNTSSSLGGSRRADLVVVRVVLVRLFVALLCRDGGLRTAFYLLMGHRVGKARLP